MTLMKITKENFTAWVADSKVLYASGGVKFPGGITKHLQFYVKLGGGYRVDLGNKTIYDGDSFDEAVEIYNNEGSK